MSGAFIRAAILVALVVPRAGDAGTDTGAERPAGRTAPVLAVAEHAHGPFVESHILPAAEPKLGWEFGWSVDVSGDTLLVGAKGLAVYFYERDSAAPNGWVRTQRVVGSPYTYDTFAQSAALCGDVAVVGSSWARAAYVYGRDEGGPDNWGLVKKLEVAPTNGSAFGGAVAIDGDVIVVSDWSHDGSYVNTGAAYVFHRDAGGLDQWGEVARLEASDGLTGDTFGSDVAVDGDTIVVGAVWDDHVLFNAHGSAYVFERHAMGGDTWSEVAKLTVDGAGHLGQAVEVQGGRIVVGAPWTDGVGAAYVFERPRSGIGGWSNTAILTTDVAVGDDPDLGTAVDIEGDLIIVGGESTETQTGAVHVYRQDPLGIDRWIEVARITASDARIYSTFGHALGIDGNTLIVGARWADGVFNNVGAAYVYERRD
jgi:hypothetical protein